jgi:2-polyprenyl-3-methyl-5-hydroxy-6-metoxy-1,4-benzoquinol methylase
MVQTLHEKALEWMEGLPKGLVLDAPSGQEALSKDLEKLGFKVVSGDIERKNIFYQNGRCIQLNLNVSFPLKDDIIDYALCVEGTEHIENPHVLTRDFARVVKRGGSLIVSTTNVMAIKSRLRFLFYSYLDLLRYFGSLPLRV